MAAVTRCSSTGVTTSIAAIINTQAVMAVITTTTIKDSSMIGGSSTTDKAAVEAAIITGKTNSNLLGSVQAKIGSNPSSNSQWQTSTTALLSGISLKLAHRTIRGRCPHTIDRHLPTSTASAWLKTLVGRRRHLKRPLSRNSRAQITVEIHRTTVWLKKAIIATSMTNL